MNRTPDDLGATLRHDVFGPVPSRRLGRSLGIDTVPPKTCNWNCVYCQLGRSVPVVITRKPYVATSVILDQVRQALQSIPPDAMDWITFVASGETVLHSELGRMIQTVKRINDRPVAVITNGSFLNQPPLRDELAVADAVMPTLDAGSDELYRKINRHHRQERQW